MKFLLGLVLIALTLLLLMTSGIFSGAPHAAWQWAESPPPTLAPEYAATPQAAQAAAQATIAAGNAAVVGLDLTGTVVALHIAQAQATENALAAQKTQAFQSTATAQAEQATSTAQAVTSTADALAFQGTATAQALQVTSTSQAIMAQGTALAAQAEKAQLEAEQQRMMNTVWAITKWGLVIVFVLLVALLVHRLTALRIVRRENGKILVLTNGVVYDPDRNPTPVLQLGPKGKAELPPASPEAQAATTARDQAIALATALGGRKPPSVLKRALAADGPAPTLPPARIEVLPPAQIRPWLDEVEGQLPPPGLGKEDRA